VEEPKTLYARTDDGAYIAYRVAGAGPFDIVYLLNGLSSRLDVSWTQPLESRFLWGLASIARLIVLDRRGIGRSDSIASETPLPPEVLVDDITAVLDVLGCEDAVVFGDGESSPHTALFAATYPSRTRALVLYAPYARGTWAPDYPWAWTDAEFEEDLRRGEQAILTGDDAEYWASWLEEMVPSHIGDPSLAPWLHRVFEFGGNPRSFMSVARSDHALDVRSILPSISVPTLVMSRNDDRSTDIAESRWIAEQIPGSTFVALDGVDHPPWAGDQDAVVREIGAFLGVSRPPAGVDRVLATILFTDIVDSTRVLAQVGDDRWKQLLAAHDERSKQEIERHRGRYVNTTGDGLFATFDGPARAIRCAQAISGSLHGLGIEIRAGCHTGEVELADDDVRGLAVHIGARVAALAGPSEVLVSGTVKDLVVGSGLLFEDAGEHELKGVPDRWRLYRVVDGEVSA
jgi:class 3 adenylate cyclase/pimeloyl-ACP methyl ester carboxylesterase